MEVLPREISVGEVVVFKIPIGYDGLMKEAGLLVVLEQEKPVYLSSNNI